MQVDSSILAMLALTCPGGIVIDRPRRVWPKSLSPSERPKGEATEEQKRITLAGRRGKLPRSKRKR